MIAPTTDYIFDSQLFDIKVSDEAVIDSIVRSFAAKCYPNVYGVHLVHKSAISITPICVTQPSHDKRDFDSL
jgi:hypothetical protein